MGRVAAGHPPGSTMTFLGVVVFRDNQNTVFFPTAPEYGDLIHAEHTPQSRHRGCRGAHRRDPGGLFLRRRRPKRRRRRGGGTFQFHSPGGQTEIIYAEEECAPLPGFSCPSLMEEGEEISLSDFEGEVVVLNAWG